MRVGILKAVWVVCSLAVLLTTLYAFDGSPNSDAALLLAYGMLTLAFPISLLLNLLAGGVGYVAYLMSGYAAETSRLSIVLTWLYFFAGGYWQWFSCVPWLVRRIRGRKRDVSRI
jgi:hypothetical protein